LTPAHKPLALLLNDHLNEPGRAYDHASQARAAFPNDPEIARLLGQLSYQRGEFSRAAQLLQESARAFPEDGEQYYYLGMAQFRTKQSESKASLTRALALAPNSGLAPEARKVLEELK
jgi:predicted Zn-dependent protease